VYHSKLFVEVNLYTKVTGLILLGEKADGTGLKRSKYHYSLDYKVRYNGREMTWEEHLNHSKPLHRANPFRVEYSLGVKD
jgi:hypothetical protein